MTDSITSRTRKSNSNFYVVIFRWINYLMSMRKLYAVNDIRDRPPFSLPQFIVNFVPVKVLKNRERS